METDSIITSCPLCAVKMQRKTIFDKQVYVCPKCGHQILEIDIDTYYSGE